MDVDKWADLMNGIGEAFGEALRAGVYFLIAFIVLIEIGLIVLVVRLINSGWNRHDRNKRQQEIRYLRSLDERKAVTDTEASGLQGNESAASGFHGNETVPEGAWIGLEQLAEKKNKTRKRNKKILKVVALIAIVGIIVGIIVGEFLRRHRFVDINSAEVGSKVLFGHYNDSNGWIVLDKKDDKLLILSEEAICYKKYNEEDEAVTWSTCSLRKWLNTEYLTQAFSEGELERIADTSVYTEILPVWNYYFDGDNTIADGENTIDKVFLLSIEEAEKYFSNDKERRTFIAVIESCTWWLRTPRGNDIAGEVSYSGEINRNGVLVTSEHTAVRPAMWIEVKTK